MTAAAKTPPKPRAAATRKSEERPVEESFHEEEPISFEEQGNLPEIKPQEGMVQRWIRVSLRGDEDRKNIYTAMRKGWTPRPASTLPASFRWLKVAFEGSEGDVVGTHDMVLMERPIELDQREKAHKDRSRKNQVAAIKQDLFNEHRDLGGAATGLTAPVMESKASVESGRPVVIQDD